MTSEDIRVLNEIDVHTKDINYLTKQPSINIPKIRYLTQVILGLTKQLRTQ